MTQDSVEQAILAQERRALDRWSRGDPLGYAGIHADETTYFDDIGAHRRIDGGAAMREYLTALTGKIPPHRYQLVDPRVQVYDDTGILTLRYEASSVEGEPLTTWKATSVYRNFGGEWRIVHAHWSVVKDS